MTINLDDDDARDINRAIAHYQATRRWTAAQGGGVLLPEGESDLAGAILGEICRDWLEDMKL
jgi:hypothetical protein